MQFYPSYKLRDVLDEYAVSFFELLEVGYRLQASSQLRLINAVSVPHMDKGNSSSYIRKLESASMGIDDILGLEDNAGGTIEDVRKMLG